MITVLEISSVGLPNITKETADAFLVYMVYKLNFATLHTKFIIILGSPLKHVLSIWPFS